MSDRTNFRINSGPIPFCTYRVLHAPEQPAALAAMIDRACTVAKAAGVWTAGGDREAAILQCRAVIDRKTGPTVTEELVWVAAKLPYLQHRSVAEQAVANLLAAASTAAHLTTPGFQWSYGTTPSIVIQSLEWMLGELMNTRLETPGFAMRAYRLEAKAVFGAWVEIV